MKFAIILGNLGNTCDRFLSSGYKEQPTKEAMIKQAAEIDGVTGIELVGSWDVTKDNADEVGELLAKYNLECVSIIPDHFSQKRWGCKRLTRADSVEKVFGDITKKNNKICATFLFSKATLDNLNINDIIDGKYDERINPG